MHKPVIFFLTIILIGCAAKNAIFIQGSIKIALPVKLEGDEAGLIVSKTWNDGGTSMIKIVDASGKHFEIYADRRLYSADGTNYIKRPVAFFLNAYPDKPNSIKIIEQKKFENTVLRNIAVP